ncbi:MAG: hypothetical protein IKI05_01515 [Bacteroidaceae bacterium]|nr:hypothetical protein [Clostridia bacterium]MBR7028074.1 hypothetical protein [Bacteroidaceae bacterium]
MENFTCPNCGKNQSSDKACCQFCGALITRNSEGKIIAITDKGFQEAEAKTNRLIKTIKRSFICIITVLFVFHIANYIINYEKNSQYRNMGIEIIEAGYFNVFADVVSIEPEYIISLHHETKTGKTIGQDTPKSVLCRCLTVEGKTIWASISVHGYPRGKGAEDKGYETLIYDADTPMHLLGKIDTAKNVAKDLEEKIGKEFVLIVTNEVTK